MGAGVLGGCEPRLSLLPPFQYITSQTTTPSCLRYDIKYILGTKYNMTIFTR